MYVCKYKNLYYINMYIYIYIYEWLYINIHTYYIQYMFLRTFGVSVITSDCANSSNVEHEHKNFSWKHIFGSLTAWMNPIGGFLLFWPAPEVWQNNTKGYHPQNKPMLQSELSLHFLDTSIPYWSSRTVKGYRVIDDYGLIPQHAEFYMGILP